MSNPDAVVIGAGPNGLAAAIVLAAAGRTVTVIEAAKTVGGGMRSEALTLPGFVHDVCAAVHPTGIASPFFRTLPLERHGLEWIDPPAAVAHPLDDGSAVIAVRSVSETASALGADASAYRDLIGRVVDDWPQLESAVLGPPAWPRHPITLSLFGRQAIRPAASLARGRFETVRARALFAGIAAHGMLPLERRPSAAFGLVLGALAHVAGWPIVRGGTQRLADALAAHARSLGVRIVTGAPVRSIDDVPPARAVLCDLTPVPFLKIAGHRLPALYRRGLERYRRGLGVFKVDWALAGPIPWRSLDCARAATVHLGGTLDEIAHAEREPWKGRTAERPFVLLAQPTLFDATRAPDGRHVAWAYCHVPNDSTVNMLSAIEGQIERFAPGFRERILGRSVLAPADLERRNSNLTGGDISAGTTGLVQMFVRPTWRRYGTPRKGLYLCSSATPPGVGVHGMCGYFAAQMALRRELRD